MSEIIVRTAEVSDMENLQRFFIKAYGGQTIFQDEKFLLYYFDAHKEKSAPLSYSLIAINSDGEIVSHYGGIHNQLKLNDTVISVVWGVNAYTLPEWRGKGINSKIVSRLQKNNEANAVIGMPFDAPGFYKNIGYNIFNRETFSRFVYVLDSSVFEIIKMIGTDAEKAYQLLQLNRTDGGLSIAKDIVELTADNYENFEFDLNVDIPVTTYRDSNFLSWRIFNNPYIKYRVFGFLKSFKITSYIVIREETLEPTKFKVGRIIDLFGKSEGIINLLHHTVKDAISSGSIYLDFSMYGRLYENELLSAGFTKLKNDDACLLPMVSSPIENRPNHEFLVLQSKLYNDQIHKLSSESVYFTRIDGDRDRIARITQLKNHVK